MTTDRQLLEDAAMAAGPDIFGEPGCYFRRLSANHSLVTGWNPLTDDGDALRLAVKLKMDVWIGIDGVTAVGADCEFDECAYDPYAATRRAIVRAAAAIGRQKGAGNG